MAISRQHNTAVKLVALTGKATITAANVQFAVENWENEAFPRKLEMQVRRWMKEHGHEAKHAGLIAAYAKQDEQSAKWLIDPVATAQDAILRLNDADDRALLVKHAPTFTEISTRMWRVLHEELESMSDRTARRLAEREDCPRRFRMDAVDDDEVVEKPVRRTRAAAEAKPARRTRAAKEEVQPTRRRRTKEAEEKPARRTRKLVEEKPARRGRTGASAVVKPNIKKVSKDYDLDDETGKPARSSRAAAPKVASSKTVNKAKPDGAIAKIRKVVGPAKKLVRNNVHMEDQMNVKKVRGAVRTVRRPRV